MHGRIISIEEIFDWYLKAIDVKSDRKAIERYIKNGNQKVEESKLIFNDLIEDILESVEIEDENKEHFSSVLENFIEFYKCFTLYLESYHTSQKQLDFLLAKDIIIPFFALFSSYVFDKHLVILEQIKPDECKKSFQRFLDWAERNICQQNINKYLINKYKNDKSYPKGYDTVKKSINNWLDIEKQTIPKKEHLLKVVKYLEDCNRGTHLNLHNLALFSKLFQSIHKELESKFTVKEIELLIEHYYCLLSFYSKQSVSFNIQETESRINNELLNHINPKIINRNCYFDEYFVWVQKVANRDYITPDKLIKEVLDANKIYYHLPEMECMKFMEISLPILYFKKVKLQNEYADLLKEMSSRKEALDKSMEKENVNLQTKLFFIYLDIKKEKSFDDKTKCNKIFKKLENEFGENDTNHYICFLKTKYFIFDNNPKEALRYCKKCVELGIGKLGEHFKEVVMTGILLSAKNDNKREYNFFRSTAIKYDSLFFGRLKIPAYGKGGALFDLPQDKNNFEELKNQYDEYFSNKFS